MEELRKVLLPFIEEARAKAEVIEPWQSFWYHRPHLNFPPGPIREIADYDGSERLSLACTQTDLGAAAQKRLVKAWCDYLPTLAGVKFLWFRSRVTQELFDAACAMPNLEGLYIKWGGITSSLAIRALKHIRYLHIGSSPSLQPLEVLSELTHLRWLELENIRAASDLSFLEPLVELRGLSVTGDSNSLKALSIATLTPLQSLKNLEWLQLGTVTVEDESLAPIARLPHLKQLLLSNRFLMEEVASLAGRLPHVSCDLFTPVGDPVEWTQCKKCKRSTMVMLTGKGAPWSCTTCDATRIQRHEDAFRSIAKQAQDTVGEQSQKFRI